MLRLTIFSMLFLLNTTWVFCTDITNYDIDPITENKRLIESIINDTSTIIIDKRDDKVYDFDSVIITDSCFYKLINNFIGTARKCDYFNTNCYIAIYKLSNNAIAVSLQELGPYRWYENRKVCIIGGISVIIDNSLLKQVPLKQFTVHPDGKIQLSNFYTEDNLIALLDESIQLILHYNNDCHLVKSELYYDCELCPPVDKSLFPEGTEFHLWGCDE